MLSPLDITYLRHLAIVDNAATAVKAAELDNALRVEPDDLTSGLMRVTVARAMGDAARAEQLLARARELAPNDPSVISASAATTSSTGMP